MKNKVELFVPGRLCLFGEHSDWAGRHRLINSSIVEGHAIVTGIEQGILAVVETNDKFVVEDRVHNLSLTMDMDTNKLLEEARLGKFFSYMCGTVAYINERYDVGGLKITILDMTLPMKKGLSSSAACCVLVARGFNQIYGLNMDTLMEMQVAYYGEINTPSRCGRLDQACAFGVQPIKMAFDGDEIMVERLSVGADFYWVFADLMSKKDTRTILSDLNACYPFAQTQTAELVQRYLGPINRDINALAVKYFDEGKAYEMGELMKYAQEHFDRCLGPVSSALKSPILHQILKSSVIGDYTYGGKGVGSQGDGSVQFLAKDKECQKLLVNYLRNILHMDAYSLTISTNRLQDGKMEKSGRVKVKMLSRGNIYHYE